MIFRTFKILGKASTVVMAAKTTYSCYKIGKATLSSYRKANKVKNSTSNILNGVSQALKNKR